MKNNYGKSYIPSAVEQVHQIDPFHRYPDRASRIHGIAGNQPIPFEAYAFHSAAIEVPPGAFRFTLLLLNLQAGSQILLLEVLNRSSVPGSVWTRLRIEGVHLSDIMANGGIWHIDVEGWPNVEYACAGYIHDEGDVSAEALLLTVDGQFSDVTRLKPKQTSQPSTATKVSNIEVRPRIAGPQIPSFVNPTSQPWTSGQTQEPAFREKLLEVAQSERATSDPWTWVEPVIFQIFNRYRALSPNARGLAVDMKDFALAALVLRHKCLLTSVKIESDFAMCLDVGAAMNELVKNNAEYKEVIAQAMSITAAHPVNVPEEFERQYDFSWWISPQSTTRIDVQNILRLMMKGLKTGGLAVLVVPFSKTPSSSGELGALTRIDIERLTLDTISHGHDVAQLRFNTPEEDALINPVPYALIARRGEG